MSRRPEVFINSGRLRIFTKQADLLMTEGLRARALPLGWDPDEPLTEQQLQGYFTLLISAGSETTRNALTGGVFALLEHPHELECLCREPDLIPSAVDEILR